MVMPGFKTGISNFRLLVIVIGAGNLYRSGGLFRSVVDRTGCSISLSDLLSFVFGKLRIFIAYISYAGKRSTFQNDLAAGEFIHY